MVDEAQNKLNEIKALVGVKTDVNNLNSQLLEFYKIIPRKMSHVKLYLVDSLKTSNDLTKVQKMIGNEQDTLDVMAGQVKLRAQQKEAEEKTKKTTDIVEEKEPVSLLEQMGLEIVLASQTEIDEVKKYAASESGKIKRVYKVTNKQTSQKYDLHASNSPKLNEQLFWHGSRNQNWFNILQTGLLIRPSGAIHTGSMFSDGIYFANKAGKSIGYSSLSGSYWSGGRDNKGYLALYKVNVGRQKHIYKHDSSCYSITCAKLNKEGFDTVYAHGGADLRNDEFIIYEIERCTIAYLIEISH
jgi:poly [ADP-ribose] polymerase